MNNESPLQYLSLSAASSDPAGADDTQLIPAVESNGSGGGSGVFDDGSAPVSGVDGGPGPAAPDLDEASPEDDETPTQSVPIDSDDDAELDPFTDDLSSELRAAATKTWRNRATVALGAVALLTVGFLGGVLVQKNFGKTPTTSASGRGFGGAGGFAGGFGRGNGTGTGQAGGGGNGTAGSSAGDTQTGVVKLIDGTTIYVQMANGDVLTVRTNDSTKVSLASTAKVSSLKKGQQVTFTGSTDASSGTVTATSVTASPAASK